MSMQSAAKTEPLTCTSSRQSFIQDGAKLGALVAFGLALAYATCSVGVVFTLRQGSLGLIRTPFFLLLGSPAILIFAILPALLLGALTGAGLAGLAYGLTGRIPGGIFALLCILVCAALVILLHYLFRIPIISSLDQAAIAGGKSILQLPVHTTDLAAPFNSYPLYIGIPSLIYILAGGVVGWRLMTRAAKSQANTT